MKHLEIRDIQRKDVEQVWQLLKLMSSHQPNEQEIENIWNKFSAQQNVKTLVAVDDDFVASFATLMVERTIRGGSIGHWQSLVTHEKYQGTGISRRIIEELEDYAWKEDCYKIVFHCRPALKDYYVNKHGYDLYGCSMIKFSPEC